MMKKIVQALVLTWTIVVGSVTWSTVAVPWPRSVKLSKVAVNRLVIVASGVVVWVTPLTLLRILELALWQDHAR